MTTMSKVEPQHAKIEPPLGAVAAGVTPDGRQLFRMVSPRARAVPRYVDTPEARAKEAALRAEGKTENEIIQIMSRDGLRLFRKNQNTGEPMYPLNRPLRYEHEELFTLESEGNWNVRKIPYQPPTPEDIAKQEREQRVRAMQETLPALLVDQGFTADELLAALRRGRAESQGPELKVEDSDEPPSPSPVTYPLNYAPARWELSDGQRIQATKEKAFAAEAAIQRRAHEAAADAAAVPEH